MGTDPFPNQDARATVAGIAARQPPCRCGGDHASRCTRSAGAGLTRHIVEIVGPLVERLDVPEAQLRAGRFVGHGAATRGERAGGEGAGLTSMSGGLPPAG